MPVKIYLVFSLAFFASSVAVSAEQSVEKLPDPLTLEYAMSLADTTHPDLLLHDARIKSVEANRQSIEDAGGLNTYLEFAAQETNQERLQLNRSDHLRAGLILSTTLYDFGQTSKKLDVVQEELTSERYAYLDARTQRRLQILEAFFNVLLADLRFSRYNEDLATAYIAFDRAQQRKGLGQETDLRVLELETEYQRVRGLRYESENLQRESRAFLAELLNTPNQLPSTLTMPVLSGLDGKLADVEEFQKLAFAKNNKLNTLRARVLAAEKSIVSVRAGDDAAVYGRLKAHHYEGEKSRSTDEVFAELVLEIPLFKPSQDGAVAKEMARLYSLRAELQKAESQLRQSVLKLWHDIEVLQVKREQMLKLNEYRELSLERSRALYEMEVKADLGTSMVELTEAQYQLAKANYQLMLALYQMKILAGIVDLDSNDFAAPLPGAKPQEQL